ncbi:S28 family serine protease [Massilibacteroides sp.]|uniref:S28 family serine protease n=1 Tax=Massilibacteroides sp. TaxID=2034766 RepID=UPI002614E475|nr:S28 family serine protease [Massilibacteroides sp.]MDD4515287.1 S28 family serine protease [Massilibacteroides sp.]
MKRLFTLLSVFLFFALQTFASSEDLKQKLQTLQDICEIERLSSDIYSEKYVIKVKQWLDHKDSTAGSFTQRVIINHIGFDRPTVLVTEGYGAAYVLRDTYQEELSRLFNTNVITVEHRYFLESTPEPKNWDYLTVENAVYDLHHITTLLKAVYPEKWISTGISKGGQTTLFYRSYFPNDVDFSIPYVAPLNRALEDGRHEFFLQKVGTKKERKVIGKFQKTILKKRKQILPLLEQYCKDKALEFRIPTDEVLDYCVLEYPFAFWQWGTDISEVPSSSSKINKLFDHLMQISGPTYFAKNQPFASFNVQAARELGYYGYDTTPFRKLLSIESSKGYFNRVMLPEGLAIQFDPSLYNYVSSFLENNDPKMIFIYGEFDPWSATRIPDFEGKQNLQIYIEPKGSHKARISTMPEKMQIKITDQINKWLEE